MRRQRSVLQSARHKNPPLAIRLHDEWIHSGDRILPASIRPRPIRGRLLHEIGLIVSRPLLLLLVPPDVLLAFAPRLAFRVGRRAVVQQAAVMRPRPAPLGRYPTLFPMRLP